MNPLIPSITSPENVELEPAGVREGADSGNPEIAVKQISSNNGIDVGIWECRPGGWAMKDRTNTEICSIVSGKGIITDADGTKRYLEAGTVLTLPKGWSGRWDITETLRKVYVIVA